MFLEWKIDYDGRRSIIIVVEDDFCEIGLSVLRSNLLLERHICN